METNWIELFEKINPDEPGKKGKIIVDPDWNNEAGKEYFESVEGLMISRLKDFKKETSFMSKDAKASYTKKLIEGIDANPQKLTKSKLFNQVTTEYRTQFLKFLKEYYDTLSNSTQIQDTGILTFNSPETKEKLFNGLKGYFTGSENELKGALNGKELPKNSLYYPGAQNKFTELFLRLLKLQLLENSKDEINTWLCRYFSFKNQKTKKFTPFNPNSVKDVLKDSRDNFAQPQKGQLLLDVFPDPNRET